MILQHQQEFEVSGQLVETQMLGPILEVLIEWVWGEA